MSNPSPDKPRKRTRRANGSIANLAKALKLSPRHVSELLKAGMPEELEAAKEWRAQSGTGPSDSAEILRRARIRLVDAQHEKAAIENDRVRGTLVLAADARKSALAVTTAAKSALLGLVETLPPSLEGLTALEISIVLRREFHAVLTRLSEGEFFDSPEIRKSIDQLAP